MSSLTLRPGATLRVPMKFWQPKPVDGSARQRLVVDAVEIHAHSLPITPVLLPADVPSGTDATLFIDASSPGDAALLESGRLYQVEIKLIAGVDHMICPAIGIEVPR